MITGCAPSATIMSGPDTAPRSIPPPSHMTRNVLVGAIHWNDTAAPNCIRVLGAYLPGLPITTFVRLNGALLQSSSIRGTST